MLVAAAGLLPAAVASSRLVAAAGLLLAAVASSRLVAASDLVLAAVANSRLVAAAGLQLVVAAAAVSGYAEVARLLFAAVTGLMPAVAALYCLVSTALLCPWMVKLAFV
jgi:hypothetical protein